MARTPSSRSRPQAAGPAALPPSMRDRVPFLLYSASQISHSLANQMLAEMALSARQAGILTMVTELEPMTQKALADALRIDRTTMVTLLDDLEDKGYVARQRHPRDRRAYLVHPTNSGRTAKIAAVPNAGSLPRCSSGFTHRQRRETNAGTADLIGLRGQDRRGRRPRQPG
jgi:DNA-binding MarR family transcriptional regulator